MPGTRAGTRRPDSSASASPAHSGRYRSAPSRSSGAPVPAVRRCAGRTLSGCTYRRWPSCPHTAKRLPPRPARRRSPAPVPAQRRGGCFPRSTGGAPREEGRGLPAAGQLPGIPAQVRRPHPDHRLRRQAGQQFLLERLVLLILHGEQPPADFFFDGRHGLSPLSACFPLILPESAAGVKPDFAILPLDFWLCPWYNICHKCGYSTSASITAFQAVEVGSIPITRSTKRRLGMRIPKRLFLLQPHFVPHF